MMVTGRKDTSEAKQNVVNMCIVRPKEASVLSSSFQSFISFVGHSGGVLGR